MNEIEINPELTKREIEIVFLLMKEFSRKMVADRLSISIHTVDSHIKNIRTKTNSHSIAGIVTFGFKFLQKAS